MPASIAKATVREIQPLSAEELVITAARRVVEAGLPALPVVEESGRFAGIFGEREFMAALFPGYVRQLRYAGFVPRKLDDAFEKRSACATEPIANHMNTEHVDVNEDFSDVEVAETFLHHRVLILPVTRNRHVVGAITRSDFFQRLAKRLLGTL